MNVTETPSGAIDGSNRVFALSRGYRPGSLAVFRNGLLLVQSLDDGWEEIDAAAGVFRLRQAPVPDDTLLAFYSDGQETAGMTLVLPLRGVVESVVELTGRLVRD